MESVIVQSPTFLTLLGGGLTASEDLARAREIAPILVAADGGAETALAHGILPHAVIGDFDSLSPEALADLDPALVHHVDEQDTTDFEKCLSRVEAPVILGVGFTGRRRDHELAAFHGLLRFPHRRCILLAEEDVICLCPPALSLTLPRATRVSLFPMGPVQGTSTGLRWPIDGLEFAPGRKIGTSNIATGDPIHLTMHAPGMLLILPAGMLSKLVQALDVAPKPWPKPDF